MIASPATVRESPLLPMQRGMLFHSIVAGDAAAYVCQTIAALDAAVDRAALRGAWEQVIERHDVLRTSFQWEGLDEPVQRVAAQVPCRLVEHDWTADDAAAQRARVNAFLAADRCEPFDLAEPPIMRFALLRYAADRALLVWTHHHALLDGRSRVLVLNEVAACYDALRHHRAVNLAPAPSFHAYVAWQRAQDRSAARDYWTNVLRDAPAASTIARALTSDGGADGEPFGRRDVPLPAEVKRAIRRVARRRRVTPNLVAQAAWAILLSRYGDARDVVFGETRACRQQAFEDLRSIVGLVMNTIAIRVRLSAATTAADVLDGLRAQHIALREHEATSLADIRTWIGADATADLFDTLVVFEDTVLDAAIAHDGGLWLPGVRRVSSSHYRLALVGYNRPELALSLKFDRRVVSDAAAARVCQHVARLLEGIVADPDRRIDELALLTVAEQSEILAIGRGRRATDARSVPEVCAAQAARTPAAIAVVQGDAALSYGELERRANQVARALRRHGVRPGARVAIALERSVDVVIAMLGILKAGAAYVPLDPGLPAARQAWLLRDVGARVVIGGDEVSADPSADDDVGVVRRSVASSAAESAAPFADVVAPAASAYVMYTSGSTGTPKGVDVPHRAIVRLVMDADYVELRPHETLLQLAPLGFDAATFEIWGALLRGGRLVLYPGATPDLDVLERLLVREQVSCLWLTASLFNLLVDSAPMALRGVRQVLTGGEALSVPHVRRAQALWPATTIINGYGPTEATTFTCGYRVPRAIGEVASIPIGAPIAGTDVCVLDRHGVLAPMGIAGELHVGGPGLAHGYVNRPGLTAARFVPHPRGAAGERLYATGDWVRWHGAGRLEFLGRRDAQVKIRGFRVEPGEVEAALRRNPDVSDAVVVVQRPAPGDKQLVAYVVARTADERETVGERVRAWLAARLPEYLVPAAVVALDALPLTANGKVDRQQLAASAIERRGAGAAPRTSVETVVAATFGELLGRAALGLDDDFFAEGGHSLLAMRAASVLRTRLAVEVPVRLLFEAPTVRQLAARLDAAERAATAPLAAVSRTARLPVSFAQERLLFLQELEGGSQYNVPLRLRLRGPLDVEALRTALTGLVARHEVLRTRLLVAGGGAVQQIDPPSAVALPVVALESIAEDARAAVAARQLRAEARRPFALAREPMLRMRLLRLGAIEHVLALTLHHAACDLWSYEVLAGDLAALYLAAVEGRPAELAPLPIQYVDYAVWQRAWMGGPAAAAQLAYWRAALQAAPKPVLPERTSPSASSRHDAGGRHVFTLPAAVARAVTALSRREGVTVFMTLLAAWQALLARYTGQTDIVVGTAISGRTRAELERLVGLFLNTLPLRTDLRGNPSFRALLARVRAVALGAYAHQDLPFEHIVKTVQPLRDGSRPPLLDVNFVLQSARTRWALRDVDAIVEEGDPGAAKFDLTLSVRDAADDWPAVMTFRTARFEAAQVAALAEHWQQLLAAAMADPDRHIGDLPLLTAAERTQLLVAWNATARLIDARAIVHASIEEQAAKRPTARAVSCGGAALTYAALNARANQLARALRARGVGPEVRVAICLERGVDLVVALLAVLKAGGAYVPLDPALPLSRLAYVLTDSMATFVLTSARHLAEVPATGPPVVCLQTLDAELAALPTIDLQPLAHPLHPAYVIYTSGSTGQPKGVVVGHGSVVNCLRSMADAPGLAPSDVVLSITTPSFDISVLEIFLPLSIGAAVVIAGDDAAHDPREVIRLLRTSGATVLQATPTMWKMLLDAGWTGSAQLTALVGGERLTCELADALARHSGALWNMYGPTETTIWSCIQKIDADGDRVPIGAPIANTTVYVLDSHGQPVPAGVAGELHIGGHGLARGYWRRPHTTAERFVPDSFSAEPGARLYRTGDVVRWLPDGTLEFVGRIDRQVKISGHRVELEEIEAILAQHPDVGAAAVLLREDAEREPKLVAYYVAAGAPLHRELKQYVRERLPAYMTPSVFVLLASMPLTASGKVDRRALPEPGAAEETADAEHVGPSTELERLLAGLWAGALGVARVSMTDNFFELGGDSLLAMRIVARACDALQVDVSMRALFDTPSLAACAAAIAAQGGDPERIERSAARFNELACVAAGAVGEVVGIASPPGDG